MGMFAFLEAPNALGEKSTAIGAVHFKHDLWNEAVLGFVLFDVMY